MKGQGLNDSANIYTIHGLSDRRITNSCKCYEIWLIKISESAEMKDQCEV